ncbi:uridine-cytidine kinase, putative [Entamoeba invadens IP1]|uniref:uridine/cytidine kinase n=2 Tax=Entamoeba invadens TaxID=33085 RepID=A0A0A1UC45_ENTIV|nr:uridine-cytidine kinase, putative [Entamoeba invadens IP1]ELP92698.1 uridine-cytidine kinase, putative [Entamoeba invadens IP1]BAN42318.1 uridine-cytidine kinase, putative [Entamoeba invadens]|eukprot:XP_004259469.1 uridine-cytidine kinase, putative [Entamoeba invadens IP1]
MSESQRMACPVLIAVCGGTASGKTTFCNVIASNPNFQKVVVISQDSFYRNLTEEEKANVAEYNFDSPNAFDWALIMKTLKRIKGRKRVEIPTYDFTTHSRTKEVKILDIGDVVIFEGLYSYYSQDKFDLCSMFDLKIFVETDDDVRLGRRIIRDMNSRGRTLESVLYQYKKFVKPAYDDWVFPQRKVADIIIPWGEISNNALEVDNEKINQYPVIKMMTRYIDQFIKRSSFEKVVRSGSAEILNDLDIKTSALSDVE